MVLRLHHKSGCSRVEVMESLPTQGSIPVFWRSLRGTPPLACSMSARPSERSRSPRQSNISYDDEFNNFSEFRLPSLLAGGDDSGAGSSSGAGSNSGASGVHSVVYVDEPSGDEACSKCMALAQRVKQLKAEVRSLQQKLEKSEEGLNHIEKTLAYVMESLVPPTSPDF